METNIGSLVFGNTYSRVLFESCSIYKLEGSSSGAMIFGLYLEYFGLKDCTIQDSTGGG